MNNSSKKQQFISQIEQKILSGEWQVGDKLPTERELVETFDTSRTVVNAALAELAQKGFLTINPRQWTQVNDFNKNGKLDVLYSKMRYNADRIDFELMQGVLDARRLIELEAVELASSNRTQEDIDELKQICSKEHLCQSLDERIKLDYAFHHMITVASKNPVYPLIMNSFEPFAKKYLSLFYNRLEEHKELEDRHEIIVKAIEDRDANKAKTVLNKLLTHGEQILGSLPVR